MLNSNGTRTDTCGTPPAPFAVSGAKGEAAIANHLHDHMVHVSIKWQLQQLAGEAAVPYGVIGCCEVDKHSSGLLNRKAIDP